METQVTEPSQPAGQNAPKAKFKINKYLLAIIILAVIVALLFYFKPAAEKPAPAAGPEEKILPNETEKPTPEIITGPLLNVSLLNVSLPESFGVGSPFSASFLINNTGNETIEDASVAVKIDDTAVYADSIKDLAVNASKTFGFTFLSTDRYYPAAGNHTLTILLNGHPAHAEGFEAVARVIAPNLEIKSFASVPITGLGINDNVTLVAYVRNIGNLDAKNATVKFFVNSNLLDTQTADIAQQITTPFKAYWTPAATGDYTLKVLAEIADDPYPEDNEYSFNVTVTNSTA